MGATRRNLQAQPKILKKIIETPNLPTRTKIFQKKNYVSYLKSVKEPKIRIEARDEIKPVQAIKILEN
jgi:hypothetical protein